MKETIKFYGPVKSPISPPLEGGDIGEGEVTN
jgi:hypothetical protein